jgi:hypothetical protein
MAPLDVLVAAKLGESACFRDLVLANAAKLGVERTTHYLSIYLQPAVTSDDTDKIVSYRVLVRETRDGPPFIQDGFLGDDVIVAFLLAFAPAIF